MESGGNMNIYRDRVNIATNYITTERDQYTRKITYSDYKQRVTFVLNIW